MKKILVFVFLMVNLFAFSYQEIKSIYLKSYNYEKMGDFKDAIKVLIPLYKKYPNGYTLNLRLGWLFYLNKDYKNALIHYEKASKIYPYSLEPKLGMMRVYLAMQNYKKVLDIGNIVLKTDYYSYYGNYYDVLGFEGIKNYKTALSLVNKMLTIYPTDVLYLSELGKIYFYMGEIKKAKEVFENVLILDPNNITAKEFLKK